METSHYAKKLVTYTVERFSEYNKMKSYVW